MARRWRTRIAYRGVATAMLRHPEKLTAATQHGILLPTSRPTTECQVRLNARRRRAMRMGSESATLHIRIDLTGISRRRQVSAAIPRTDTRLAQWSPYAAVWSRLSADMTGWARRGTGCGPVDLILAMVKAGNERADSVSRGWVNQGTSARPPRRAGDVFVPGPRLDAPAARPPMPPPAQPIPCRQ